MWLRITSNSKFQTALGHFTHPVIIRTAQWLFGKGNETHGLERRPDLGPSSEAVLSLDWWNDKAAFTSLSQCDWIWKILSFLRSLLTLASRPHYFRYKILLSLTDKKLAAENYLYDSRMAVSVGRTWDVKRTLAQRSEVGRPMGVQLHLRFSLALKCLPCKEWFEFDGDLGVGEFRIWPWFSSHFSVWDTVKTSRPQRLFCKSWLIIHKLMFRGSEAQDHSSCVGQLSYFITKQNCLYIALSQKLPNSDHSVVLHSVLTLVPSVTLSETCLFL